MTTLKLSLLDDEDLKLIETMLVRAGIRIFRQLAKEGLIGGQIVQTAAPTPAPVAPPPRELPTSEWPATPSLRERVEVPPPPQTPPTHDEEEEEEPVVIPGLEPEPPRREPPVFLRPPPPTPPPPPPSKSLEPTRPKAPPKRKYRSVQQVCKTVGERPHGYITTEDAYNIMGGVTPSGQLSQYVHNREVEALIVASVKPPTKGLPGRLMINKESLIKRLELRDHNARRSIRDRRGPAPQPQPNNVETDS